MRELRIGVYDEHEIFRRGVVACLREEPGLRVTEEPQPGQEVDVAVVSVASAAGVSHSTPLVVCSDTSRSCRVAGRRVHALLPRRTLDPDQLVAAVRAAAVGLHVEPDTTSEAELDPRSLEILRLLAEGLDTREISSRIGYSERTTKAVIAELQRQLGTRSRAHSVAEAVRKLLI